VLSWQRAGHSRHWHVRRRAVYALREQSAPGLDKGANIEGGLEAISQTVGETVSNRARRIAAAGLAIFLCFLALSCSPDVGSEAWCEKMNETPKGDWSANEAADYAKHCLFE
jgi:hypothetical protein